MKIKLLLAALAISAAPSLAIAQCSAGKAHETTAMSCVEGLTWDAATQACVPVTSS
ncbi:carbohydrate-binding module family 14 protein [Palleronia sp. KMU-117]|uniref:carbohydrate-binding module family 14 protein n=1 Tax=Palleronia sp. KMU-117 TaxID=3434108 RepID=UPI003D7043DE